MRRRAGRAWAVGLVLGMAWATRVLGLGPVPEVEESLEFRFADRIRTAWRGQRPLTDRWVGSPSGSVRMVSESGVREVWMTDRVAFRAVDGGGPGIRTAWDRLGLRWMREGAGGIQILRARDPWAAARAADVLAESPGVDVAVPVMRRRLAMHTTYAPRPDDPFFPEQWQLENRDAAGRSKGPDLHVRSAWPVAEGAGVTVAICDDGFETDHPDLRAAAAAVEPHFDFLTGRSNASVYGSHATCVAGLVAATSGNGVGLSGVAPKARLASWMIFDAFGDIANDEALMDMFQHDLQAVSVQNHSWGNASAEVSAPTALESAAISNAVENGRAGRGVVMVRSGGNDREQGNDVNDDAYANDPRVIAVAAVRRDGGIASYSNPGACLLVGAPSGDEDDITLPVDGVATTDRVGSRGYNRQTGANSLADYALGLSGFSGTSASAPQISGVAALVLSANTNLTARDVQQVLIHAARPPVGATPDPDLHRNAAGYAVSHNVGFGVPDTGQAVRLAKDWTLRPPRVVESVVQEGPLGVPDAGLRFWIQPVRSPEQSIVCEGAPGPHPDQPTGKWPITHVGLANAPLTANLTNRVALIQRGGNTFREKLTFAARAGARFAVFYNNIGGTTLVPPGYTDFVGIPAVFIPQDDGEALAARLEAGERVEAELRLETVSKTFEVSRPLVCEHVGLRVRSNHDRRGDLRITLVSPGGTRSVLQRRNFDSEPGPVNWTYWSIQHFYESSVGSWRAEFSDQVASWEGEILEAELMVWGVAIEDTDKDGLDDAWERRWFGNLESSAAMDPDLDGSSNAREQVLGTDPTREDEPFRISVAPFDIASSRLSWPATDGLRYTVRRRGLGLPSTGSPEEIETVIPGRFPEIDWVVPWTSLPGVVYRVESTPK